MTEVIKISENIFQINLKDENGIDRQVTASLSSEGYWEYEDLDNGIVDLRVFDDPVVFWVLKAAGALYKALRRNNY